MRKVVYGIFMLIAFMSSWFIHPEKAGAAIKSVTTEKNTVTKITEKNLLYFADIVEQQNTSGFVSAHYSHRSHGSHGSHGSHRSHYSSY